MEEAGHQLPFPIRGSYILFSFRVNPVTFSRSRAEILEDLWTLVSNHVTFHSQKSTRRPVSLLNQDRSHSRRLSPPPTTPQCEITVTAGSLPYSKHTQTHAGKHTNTYTRTHAGKHMQINMQTNTHTSDRTSKIFFESFWREDVCKEKERD